MNELISKTIDFFAIPIFIPILASFISYLSDKNSQISDPTQQEIGLSYSNPVNYFKHLSLSVFSHSIWGVTALTNHTFLKETNSNFWIMYLVLILWSFVVILYAFNPLTNEPNRRLQVLIVSFAAFLLRTISYFVYNI